MEFASCRTKRPPGTPFQKCDTGQYTHMNATEFREASSSRKTTASPQASAAAPTPTNPPPSGPFPLPGGGDPLHYLLHGCHSLRFPEESSRSPPHKTAPRRKEAHVHDAATFPDQTHTQAEGQR